MAAIKLCFTLAISFALLSLVYTQPAGDYRSFCQKTSMANICIQTIDAFTSNPKLKVNANGWLQILNFRTISLVLTTRTKIGDALRSNPSPELRKRLNVCNDRSNFAYNTLNSIDWTLLNHNNYVQYNRQLGFALGAIDDCIDAFKQPPPIQSPVAVLTQTTDDAIKLDLEGLNVFQCNKRTACN